jgi:hypothetical protein
LSYALRKLLYKIQNTGKNVILVIIARVLVIKQTANIANLQND